MQVKLLKNLYLNISYTLYSKTIKYKYTPLPQVSFYSVGEFKIDLELKNNIFILIAEGWLGVSKITSCINSIKLLYTHYVLNCNLITKAIMSLYESVILIQQDVSSAFIDQIVEDLRKILLEYNATVLKKESWGLRSLAYEIKGHSKAHYVMLYIECSHDALKEYERKMQLSENVIRFMNLKVDSITDTPLLEISTEGKA